MGVEILLGDVGKYGFMRFIDTDYRSLTPITRHGLMFLVFDDEKKD